MYFTTRFRKIKVSLYGFQRPHVIMLRFARNSTKRFDAEHDNYSCDSMSLCRFLNPSSLPMTSSVSFARICVSRWIEDRLLVLRDSDDQMLVVLGRFKLARGLPTRIQPAGMKIFSTRLVVPPKENISENFTADRFKAICASFWPVACETIMILYAPGTKVCCKFSDLTLSR